jgi:hypothetical protein
MGWIYYSVILQHISHLHIASTVNRWFSAFPSPLRLPQSDHNPVAPRLSPAILTASRLPAAIPSLPHLACRLPSPPHLARRPCPREETDVVRRSTTRRRSLTQHCRHRARPPCPTPPPPHTPSVASTARVRLNSSQSHIPHRSSSHGIRSMAVPGGSASDPWRRPGAPPTHAAITPGNSASDPWQCARSGAPSSYVRRVQEWRCWHAQAEGRHRGAKEEWRVALPSRTRGRGPVTGAKADVDNRFQDATRREEILFL